jgi:hypothetical protein
MRQADPDFWGYLSAGRLFAEQHGLVSEDPFAFTAPGHRWITFEYGAEVALWFAYRYGGALGLIAFKSLLGGTALFFLAAAFRTMSDRPPVWVPLFLVCASGLSRFFLFRPQLFTFAAFAFFTSVLFRHLRGSRTRLWLLPLVMIAWANAHGGFVAGLGAIALTIGLRAIQTLADCGWHPRRMIRSCRPLLLTLAASALATFANPQGARLWAYVLTELTHTTNRQYIREWSPATFANDAWSTSVLIVLALALLLVAAVSAARWTRTTPGPPTFAWAASAMPLVVMSFVSVRHVPLAAIWAGPIVALLGSEHAERLDRKIGRAHV